ncbi:MAG: hypothetical protein ACYC56_04210 [Candidatus Aquicultor sp.]
MLLKIDKEKYSFELGMMKMHGWINEDLTLTELGVLKKETIKELFPQLEIVEDSNELRIS